ncbi:L-serine ammonia-lyase, iron-sulfur-dependent, subunit alpha [Fusibacter sp. JL216-2]|uniref:L-serine ammonia-lyase, iron-sulfur-dependent, subunit alpha n=1 Tax=Fusibacter sp. JL216-2 TaxID=3071453 RepID=UPI003D327ACF
MKYKFTNGAQLLDVCEKEGKSIYEVMILRECESKEIERSLVIGSMTEAYEVMKSAIEAGMDPNIKSVGGLIGGGAHKLSTYAGEHASLAGKAMTDAIAAAMAVSEVNASMGKIVAAPTAGSCGILPGAVVKIGLDRGLTDETIVNGLFTASAVGYLIARNATVSGAEGGCQAETGTAAAMAAAGLVEMLGGTPKSALSAAAFTIKNILGLVCDPIAGLVECPCEKRNAIGTANAVISADMALAGITTIVPFDEVVDAMRSVGRIMSPTLKETSMGGLADAPTARELEAGIFGDEKVK